MKNVNKKRRADADKSAVRRVNAHQGLAEEAPHEETIDTSDIPDMKGTTGWVRIHQHPEHPLHRVFSRLLSIRLAERDIELARRLAALKGLPYQTFIKSLLHEALERERAVVDGN